MAALVESNMSLSDHTITSHESDFAEMQDGRTNTMSMISIPLSENDIVESTQTEPEVMPGAAFDFELDQPTIPDLANSPAMTEFTDDAEKRRTIEIQKADMTPVLSSPKRFSRSSRKSRHVRQKSSLQEPDMAALLARLELENSALAKDPKSGIATVGSHTGPGASFEYRVRDTVCSSLSLVTIPEEALGMTLGEFWALVTKDYAEALRKLPTMTPLMIHKGIPAFLRSAVWPGIAGAFDPALQVEFDSLCERLVHERPLNESIIQKDLSRCFPQHEMFKDAEGEGQQLLGTLLKAYSLYDSEVGYCQGMAFVAGVLLMNMPVKDAFCIFVKLMETQNLRSLYSLSLSGLHSRTFQLKKFMASLSPNLLEHLTNLGLEPAYLSQWFMTIYATNCPFNVLFRIYDVIFAEGADETIMRVALALIISNEHRLMAMTELEEVLHLLLGRSLWEPYQSEPDFLMDEIARLSNVVTRQELDKWDAQFVAQTARESEEKTARALGFASGFKFFDGIWGGSTSPNAEKKNTLAPETPGHAPKRSVSKRSVATIDSSVGTSSGADSLLSNESASTAMTEIDKEVERSSLATFKSSRTGKTEDRSLHEQVEGLLLALTEVQREAAQTAEKLKMEHARKESMASIVFRLRDIVSQKEQPDPSIQGQDENAPKKDRRKTMPSRVAVDQAANVLKELQRRSAMINTQMPRSISLNQLAHIAPDEELQDSLSQLCALLDNEPPTPSADTPAMGTPRSECGSLFDGRAGPSNLETTGLTRTKRRDSVRFGTLGRRMSVRRNNLQPPATLDAARQSSIVTIGSVYDDNCYFEPDSGEALDKWPDASMFEEVNESPITEEPVIAPRQSSLSARGVLETAGSKPTGGDEAILLELINAKTREAEAIQERDEFKKALDKMRKQQDEMSRQLAAQTEAMLAEQSAHAAELDKLRRAITKVKNVPSLEIRAEASPGGGGGSLWPSPSPSPGNEPTTPKKDLLSTGEGAAGGGWGWFSRGKQRAGSTGNASILGTS